MVSIMLDERIGAVAPRVGPWLRQLSDGQPLVQGRFAAQHGQALACTHFTHIWCVQHWGVVRIIGLVVTAGPMFLGAPWWFLSRRRLAILYWISDMNLKRFYRSWKDLIFKMALFDNGDLEYLLLFVRNFRMMFESPVTLASNSEIQYLRTLLCVEALHYFYTLCIQILIITIEYWNQVILVLGM